MLENALDYEGLKYYDEKSKGYIEEKVTYLQEQIDNIPTSGGGSNVNIIDNLETADSESALSANQGKVLNEKIELIETGTVVAEYDEDTENLTLELNVPVKGIIEDTLESTDAENALSAKQGKVLNEKVETATDIAKGKNKARVFNTTEDMYNWLSNADNQGLAMRGDNLYIVDIGVPDWWISEVLETPNADGRYYEVAQLETQKVDLTTINEEIDEINSKLAVKYIPSPTGVKITYDNNWVNVSFIIPNYNIDGEDDTTVTLPDNVQMKQDIYITEIFLTNYWYPTSDTAYIHFATDNKIYIRPSKSLTNVVLIFNRTYPRSLFKITEN